MFNEETLDTFPLKSTARQLCIIQHSSGGFSNGIRQEKDIRGINTGRGGHLLLLTDNCVPGKPRNSIIT